MTCKNAAMMAAYLPQSNKKQKVKAEKLKLKYKNCMSYASLPIWKLHPHSDIISKLYKPAFHNSYLSCNTSYGSATTIWVFYLPQ